MPATMLTAIVAAPGTPQRLTTLTTPALPQITGMLSGPATLRGSFISFQASPFNTAAKSIYIGGPTMNVAARTGIGMVLAPGAFSMEIYVDGGTDLSDFWIDTDSVAVTERVFVTVVS